MDDVTLDCGHDDYLVGGFNPSEKYESQWEGLSHILWEKKMFQTTNQICNDKKIIENHLPGHSFYSMGVLFEARIPAALVRKFLASNRFGPWNYLNTSLLEF